MDLHEGICGVSDGHTRCIDVTAANGEWTYTASIMEKVIGRSIYRPALCIFEERLMYLSPNYILKLLPTNQ